jgi:hypothetical protein
MKFRSVAVREKRHAQKKQIARLHRFHIGAERFRRRRELDATFFTTKLTTGSRCKRWARSSLLLGFILDVLYTLSPPHQGMLGYLMDVPDLGLQVYALVMLYTAPGQCLVQPEKTNTNRRVNQKSVRQFEMIGYEIRERTLSVLQSARPFPTFTRACFDSLSFFATRFRS